MANVITSLRRTPTGEPGQGGQPETSRTLMTCVVAGKTEVPFFFSASDLIETEDGVGADRVYKLVRRVAAAVLSIDEPDATCKSLGPPSTTDQDGRWQPSHQLLTELDRLSAADGIVVLAATNRSYPLASALVRPGRTDSGTTNVPPDLDGRMRILHDHTRSVPLAEDVDLEELAAATPDMAASDLGDLITDAALLAAFRCHSRVTRSDFSDALEELTLGNA
jgi:cell division protease FtsH